MSFINYEKLAAIPNQPYNISRFTQTLFLGMKQFTVASSLPPRVSLLCNLAILKASESFTSGAGRWE
jgi:hypothetical protein